MLLCIFSLVATDTNKKNKNGFNKISNKINIFKS